MGNDKAREPGDAGRASAVHSEDRGSSGVAKQVNQGTWQLSLRDVERDLAWERGCGAERLSEFAKSGRRDHSSGPSRSVWAGHAAGNDG